MSALDSSVGKNDSTANSANVTSSGVPSTEVVLNSDSSPWSVR